MKRAALLIAAFLAVDASAAENVRARNGAAKAREWHRAHQTEILAELKSFLAIPNLATDTPNINRNAAAIVKMFARRGIAARLLSVEGAPPLVVADVPAQGARETIAFYAHYDGQPVDPAQWTSPPWQPEIRPAGAIGPESRIYARSASDDKSPIVALLAALDAVRAAKLRPSINIRFVFEGEEEQGSPHLEQYLERYADQLRADAWVLADGPVHPTRKMQLYFGARGIATLEVTTYGPSRALHSGNYGNWAVNPIIALTRLLATMRDDEARILIPGFYDDVRPLTEAERAAIAAAPSADTELRREVALGRTEGAGKLLVEQIHTPGLNVRGIRGGDVGEQSPNAIPTEARASIDFRLVPSQTPEKVRERVERHIASLGFHIVHQAPDAATRLAHPRVARLDWGSGYPPARTLMDLPISRRAIDAVSAAIGEPVIVMPSLGGSVPIHMFQRGGTPVIGAPMVNHDNRQHAADENLRLQNLWDGIEVYAALFAGL